VEFRAKLKISNIPFEIFSIIYMSDNSRDFETESNKRERRIIMIDV